MSDKPLGPDWWLASDGTWHPPELHPSLHQQDPTPTVPVAVPDISAAAPMETQAATNPSTEPAAAASVTMQTVPKRPTWSGESDRRPDSGPMYPDLFSQAVSGSRLADAITVNFADGEHRDSLDVPPPTSRTGGSTHPRSDADRSQVAVGAFVGASAKKRWRKR